MTAMAYEITAEILSAYDDERVGTAAGTAEVEIEGAYGETTVTVTLCGTTAETHGTVTGFGEIDAMVQEAAFLAAIWSGANGGCQLGRITYGEEIEAAA